VPLNDAEKELAKGQGGYAREMGEDYRKRQRRWFAERIKSADIVVTTALIPGRRAPVLVTEDMVKSMKPGSVIVDMAAEQGGNCPLTEADKVLVKHGVTLVGHTNFRRWWPRTPPPCTRATCSISSSSSPTRKAARDQHEDEIVAGLPPGWRAAVSW